MKGVLKFIMTELVVQFVMTPSMQQMEWLFVDSWDMHRCK